MEKIGAYLMADKFAQSRQAVSDDREVRLLVRKAEHLSELGKHPVKDGDCDLARVDLQGLERLLDVGVSLAK